MCVSVFHRQCTLTTEDARQKGGTKCPSLFLRTTLSNCTCQRVSCSIVLSGKACSSPTSPRANEPGTQPAPRGRFTGHAKLSIKAGELVAASTPVYTN